MRSEQREIIRNALWAAGASGVLIGPGTDAAALIAIWATAYGALADEAGLSLNEDVVKKVVASLFQAFAVWYVSGEVAQVIMAAVTGFLATMTVATLGVGAILGAVMYLGSNALINVFFTWRFLRATAKVMDGASTPTEAASEAAMSVIVHALTHLDNIVDDLKAMARAMAP